MAFRNARLGALLPYIPTLQDAFEQEEFWNARAELGDTEEQLRPTPVIPPDPDYEAEEVARASASVTLPAATPLWGVIEVRLDRPAHGNPFIDVELHAVFRRPDGSDVQLGGFYDGEGGYLVRVPADVEGFWTFGTTSTARSLDGISGAVMVTEAREGSHGPVRVDGFHFRHADDSRHRPLGTTAYAWTHQPDALQEQTLATLAEGPFRKIRMCLFPKSYLLNASEPEDFVFPGSLTDRFDLERFDPAHFRRLERRIAGTGDVRPHRRHGCVPRR
ncbi:DUF5060 domain-containing protein [Nonomuraea sp. NPDC049695]|uniref:DUF5060 domain-containing protein n=1 Tax=Nonomuraea sp. NPDC049695 TaxID=3154734 RepID=UPI0034342238